MRSSEWARKRDAVGAEPRGCMEEREEPPEPTRPAARRTFVLELPARTQADFDAIEEAVAQVTRRERARMAFTRSAQYGMLRRSMLYGRDAPRAVTISEYGVCLEPLWESRRLRVVYFAFCDDNHEGCFFQEQ